MPGTRKLGRDTAHRTAMLRAMVTFLLENGKIEADAFRGAEKEEIVRFCREVLQGQHFDYFIFGHRHLPIDVTLSPSSRYINTGDWITYYSFASFDGREVVLETEDKNQDFHFDLL